MDIYTVARTIARTLIASQEGDLTTDKIRECVTQACTNPPANDLTDEQRENLVRELETIHQTVIGEERQLVGAERWEYWLPERRGQLTWDYWDRYKEFLRQGPMNEDVRLRLDDSSDSVLGLLGDPCRSGSWDRRGLVVGLVQSGKTSHYIGLINKAVDAGYKVIVILTGFTESLRVQTQIRAENGFLGYYLQPAVNTGKMRSHRIGVGNIAPGKMPDSVTTRSNDFKKAIADNFGIQVGGNEILFVIKKNVSVLGNLLNWIENLGNATDATGRRFVKDVPVLVIDDESDVGSIDTKKGNIVDDDPDPEHEPSRINEQIRKLLSLFDQSSYVGYTATPFANVLIHEGGRTDELGEDLFPRNFIISLPTPSDHVGPAMLFGRKLEEGEQEKGLPIIRHIPIRESEGEEAWIPSVHKKWYQPLFEGRDEVPPSLRKAILSFVLVCAARRLRVTGTKHNSMLVHVTRFTDLQEKVNYQVKKELKGVVDRLRNRTAADGLLRELQKLWRDDFIQTTRDIAGRSGAIFQNPEHEWEEVEGELLATASSIQIRSINGQAGEVLDYETHPDGLNVIAVGGDKLSRGLTLDGLTVSYFGRCSRMYDTLMQMGRWFGYRLGYLDLCRLYTTTELCEWFGHIANATEELREEFDLMANSGGTPTDFGLRVRSHPELMVTSQVKMRHGETIQITFQGDIVETINFYWSFTVVDNNWKAAKNLVEDLEAGAGTRSEERPLWKEIPAENVISFLDQYKEHESAKKVRTRLLKQYIEKEVQNGRLESWTVLISGGSDEKILNIGDVRFRLVERRWHLTGSTEADMNAEREALIRNNQYRIRRLVSGSDEAADLDKADVNAALKDTIEDYRKNPGRRKREPTVPSGKFLRQRRAPSRGLLILYPLVPNDKKSENEDIPIVGFAISFPAVQGSLASKVTYTVNNVYQTQEMD